MHRHTRIRGKVLRYIKNQRHCFFSRSEPLSEMRAIKGEHAIRGTKLNRKLPFGK